MFDWASSVRPLRLSDAVDLQKNCYPEHRLAEVRDYAQWCILQMDKGRMVRLVVEAGGEVVANGQLTLHPVCSEIGSLLVSSAFRRKGVGTALLEALVAEAHKRRVRTIEVMASSEAAWLQEWYRRQGFADYGEKILPGDERVAVLRRSLSLIENEVSS